MKKSIQEKKLTDSNNKEEEDLLFYLSNIIEYYGYILGQLQYEGSGIWSRFNIMIGLNISLFGLMTFLYTSTFEKKEILILIISIGGLFFSVWSIFVLSRLWSYHYHWKEKIKEIEKLLPDNFVKPFSKMPINLKQRNITKFKVLLKSYTQPFFAILVLIWITIIIINLNLLTNKKNNDIIKKDVITQSNSKSPIENKHKDVITQSNDKSSIENKHKDDSVTIKK